MQRWYSLFLPRSAKPIAWMATLVVFTISLLALIGWFLDIALLRSVRPQWVRMSVITAVCLILACAQLTLLQVNPSSLRRLMVLQAPAVLVSLVGLLTLAFYCYALVTGQEPSFGSAPILDPFGAQGTRLALLTGFIFLLTGIALALLANGSRRAANIAHTVMLPVAMISYLVLVSYLLGVQAWYGLFDLPMALNTGLAFSALSVAIFCVHPDTWLMKVLTSDQAGGIMARRLLPALLMIPLLIGWLRLYGERSGAFVSEVGVALVAVAYTFCLLGLVLLTAASLNRADSERRQVEKALLESDVRFKSFMDNSPAIAWAKDEAGRYVYLSKACENRFGIRLKDCRGKTDFDLWPQDIAREFRENDLKVLASGQTTEVIEENINPDGSSSYWWNFKFPFSDVAGGRYVGGVGVDITERQRAEEALRQAHDDLEQRVKDRTAELERANEALRQSEKNLRFLTSQTLTAQEKGRQRISYELHDGVGQSLTVLKLHLRSIQKMMPPSGPERDEFESALNYMNSIVENVRRLSEGLSPLMLEDLGLPAALKNLFEETCRLEGIDCFFEMDDIKTLLPLEAQIIIYRVCQEILNNVIKHAQASRIELGVQRLDGGVQFSVMDNGIGFDVGQILASSLKDRGMGLAYMEEQVRMFGGTISISSKPREGTRINITIPFPKEGA